MVNPDLLLRIGKIVGLCGGYIRKEDIGNII